jgi:hypothetical protein
MVWVLLHCNGITARGFLFPQWVGPCAVAVKAAFLLGQVLQFAYAACHVAICHGRGQLNARLCLPCCFAVTLALHSTVGRQHAMSQPCAYVSRCQALNGCIGQHTKLCSGTCCQRQDLGLVRAATAFKHLHWPPAAHWALAGLLVHVVWAALV